MKRTLLTYIIMLFSCVAIAQFGAQQTQYMFNAIGVNPGATGQHDALNATLSHRSMWQGVEGAPTTDYISVHTPLRFENFAAGIQFYHDKIGVSSTSTFMLSGAYKLKVGAGKLSFGLMAGMRSGTNRWSQVQTLDSDDQAFNSGDISYLIPAAGFGVYYYDKKSFAGFSTPQLLQPVYAGGGKYQTDADIKNFTYHLILGRRFKINETYGLMANALIKRHYGSPIQSDISLFGTYQDIAELGLTYRHGDAISIIARGRLNPQTRLSYSYDINTNALSKYSAGSHELTLSYTFHYKTNSRDSRTM